MTQTQTLARMKKPFGTAKMVDLTAVRYLAWEDTFEVDFEDGLTFLEPHATIRKANRISPKAEVERVEIDGNCHEGFFVHYDNGQRAEFRGNKDKDAFSVKGDCEKCHKM